MILMSDVPLSWEWGVFYERGTSVRTLSNVSCESCEKLVLGAKESPGM